MKKGKDIPEKKAILNATSKEPERVTVPKKYFYFSYIVLFFLSFFLYINTFHHDYVLDDAAVITKNKIVQQGIKGIPELLRTGFYYGYFGYNNNLYRPLPLITFAIGHSLWGNNPHREHLINILLYALAATFLFYTLIQLVGKHRWLLAFLVSLLFIAHPIHTEVVANIKSRDEILAFLFCLGSLASSLIYARKKNVFFLFIGAASLFLAMLSKESAISFVVIIPLSIYFFVKPGNESLDAKELKNRIIVSTITASFAVIAYLTIRFILFHNDKQTTSEVLSIDNVMSNTGFFDRLPTAILVLGRYLKLLFLPQPLTYDYSFKELTIAKWGDVPVIFSFLAYAILLGIAIYFLRKRNIISYSILFFLSGIFIVSNILLTIGAGMAERFLFTPSLGFCIAIGFLIFKITNTSMNDIKDSKLFQRVLPVSLILISGYGFKTITRNQNWESQLSLFSNDIKNSPLSARAHYSLGNELFEKGKKEKDPNLQKEMYNKAEAELKRTLSIYPNYAEAVIAIGNIYQEKGDYEKANEYMSKIGEGNIGGETAKHEELLYNQANALLGLKNYRGAIDKYKEAIAANPELVEAYINMGLAYKDVHQTDSAIYIIKKGLEINPKYTEGYLNLGTCYSELNDFNNAIANFKKAIELKPDFAEAYIDLGDVYNRMNKLDEAEKNFKRAYELNPGIPQASFNLGYLYIKKNDFKQAYPYLQKAIDVKPDYIEAIINICYAASKIGRYQDLVNYALKGIATRPDIPELYYDAAYGYNMLGNKAKALEYKDKGDKVKK